MQVMVLGYKDLARGFTQKLELVSLELKAKTKRNKKFSRFLRLGVFLFLREALIYLDHNAAITL